MRHETCIESREVFNGRVLHLTVDRVRLPNGRESELEVIEHPGASAVVAIDDDVHVLLVNQYRYATGGWVVEIPAGKLDPGEAPETCAHRELEEEVGCRAGSLISLGWIWTTPGFTDEKIWLYLATDLETTQQNLCEHEVLSVERHPFDEACAAAESGEMTDGKTVCALLRARHHLSRGTKMIR